MKLFNITFRSWLLAAFCIAFMGNAALAQSTSDKEGKIRKKVFIFIYAEHVQSVQIDSVKSDFLALPELVDGMISAEWGKDTNNTQKHCLILTFTIDEAHERYVNHPIHKAIPTKFAHLTKEGFEMKIANFWAKP